MKYNNTNVTSHIWTKNSVFIQTFVRHNGQTSCGQVEINFPELMISRSGLLEQAILDTPCPLNPLTARSFLRTLKTLSKSNVIQRLLGTPVEQLNYQDVWKIFQNIEQDVKDWNYNQPYTSFINAIRIFKYCKTQLSNGQFVRDVQYTATFKYEEKKIKKLISETYDTDIEDIEMAAPISLLKNSSASELDRKALKHLQIRLDRISDACDQVIQNHLLQVIKIKKYKELGLPESYTLQKIESILARYNSLKDKKFRIPANDRLSFFLYVIERFELYVSKTLPEKFSFTNLPLSDAQSIEWSPTQSVDYLLCDYYLPRNVVCACVLLLLIETGWNPSTLLTLSEDRIDKSVPGEFRLEGVKTKTGQLQVFVVKDKVKDSAKSSLAYRSIELLLQHNSNINSFATRNSDSIFIVKAARTGNNINVFDVTSHLERDIERFCDAYNIPIFSLKDIRDQKANLEYMKSGKNPYVPMTILGHADLSSITYYLNSTILRVLNEANMNEFMRRLGDSILFVGGRIDNLADSGKNLLFPISRYNDQSIADTWLNNIGNSIIPIGRAEIKHCAMQMRYYKEIIPDLKSTNTARFKSFHLPRIIFCIAMYKFIFESEYRSVLREIEKELSNG